MKDFRFPIRPRLLPLLTAPSPALDRQRPRAEVWLDANENPFNAPLNRYAVNPDELVDTLSRIRRVPSQRLFLCRGTYEALELLLHLCCTPRQDNVITTSPTISPVQKLCLLHDVECRTVELDEHFNLTAAAVLRQCNDRTRLCYLCSPNNPTGNLLDRQEILHLAEKFHGLVLVDEAYVDFANCPSLVAEQEEHPNLVVIHSFSAILAAAGLCLATVYAHPELVDALRAIRPDHHLSSPVLEEAGRTLKRYFDADRWKAQILDERTKVMAAFRQLACCTKVYPSDANFFMARMHDGRHLYQLLEQQGIHVFSCQSLPRCQDCLRITIGLNAENSRLLGALRALPRKSML